MGDSSNFDLTPRRLSKPRTNKSSSNLLGEQPTTPSSPHNSSDQDYFGGDAVVVNSHGECRSRSKSRGRIRAYLYGSSHDVIQTSSDDEEAPTGIAGAARDVRKRLSRTGSSIMPLQSAKASATRLSNSSSSGLLSTRSTESQAVDPEESAMVADQIKQRAYHDSLAAQNHVSTPVDEDRHVDSFMAPLRRKSLYTPGIATRNASDILQKPPKPPTDHDYYYDPSRPEVSPLSHLATLTVSEDGRSTPCDLQYLQLGGLRLGTLRVTNGISSLPPGDETTNLACRSATPESKTHDEYYTASEGSMTEDWDHATPLAPRDSSPLKYESKIDASIRTDNQVPSSPDMSLPFERESSKESFPFSRQTADQAARVEKGAKNQSTPFRMERLGDILLLEEGTSNESSPLKQGLFKACPVEAVKPNRPLVFEDESCDSSLRQMGSSVEGRKPNECLPFGETSPNGASGIADEYIAELDGSPFSYPSLEDMRKLMPQPQHPGEETWRSFIDDAEVQHAGNGSGSREDALRKLTVNGNSPSTRQPESLSVLSTQPLKYSAALEIPQADSGYSSYASLTAASAHEACIDAGSELTPYTKALASPPPQAVETVRSSARSSFRVPTRKLQKQRPKSQPPPVNIIPGFHELTDANIPRIPSIIAMRHVNRLSQFPLLEHTFPSSQHTTADRTFSPTQTRDAPFRFPSPANALEAASAPPRPLPTPSSKPRANTIVLEEDEWGASDLVRNPSWSDFGGGRRRKEQKKLAKEENGIEKRLQKEEKEFGRRLQKDRKDLEKQIKKDENKQRSTRSRSASRTRARSSEGQSRDDTPVKIADFGSVVEVGYLGKNPYDIAASTYANQQNTRNWHPHQISTARPNSLSGARFRAQSMFSDMPSVPALAAVDLKTHNLEWARDRQRSHSSSAARAELFNNGIPGRLRRPKMTEDTPPVPALPSAKQVKQREQDIIRSRPHSMIVEVPVPTPTSGGNEGLKAVPYPSESDASVINRQKKGGLVPDLWSNGSLERKIPKTSERSRQQPNNSTSEIDDTMSANDKVWGTESQAWSQRRKSAGEALLRNQNSDVLDNQEGAKPTPLYERNERPTSMTRAVTSGSYQAFMPTPSHLGPFPNPLALHPQPAAQHATSTPNTSASRNQSSSQQTQRPGYTPLASPPRPSMFSLPTPPQRNAQTQSFQIQRKRVGSGSSIIRAETAMGSSRHPAVLV
ncbi:hypothetical protein IMSHALPRED_002713 [Imshaugia aleurites]|uniref:Uncharacterized protein n=1 Tax=Imshaugia aleurites TaxID=172621 RepID=A0A8H3F2H7_9LECA|nr:hypothetical protein IMSHALPRED_002713 [Imshaugia aleurites]